MGFNKDVSAMGQLFKQFGKLGTKFEFWGIEGYSTPEGQDVAIYDGICVVVDSLDGASYAEWVFDENGALEQFAVWDRPA